ncbi:MULTISPECIES: ankyrin repeat domain-containing protein [Lysobacter]|uniref:ankyrin repeat domain-containing protein n=1 Tax=Lysobacter TaxID=68 RepID=UPI001F166677|nr:MULTISPECIES: ankyrin repeat domain-containing protein [Lysobacter]UJB17704.1 ankyrin repeat domain-containing protein [Lysobacter capsici]UJQ28574.1 ankyrin repeat domain-containing protein [Lysobacter gummosus]
MTPISSPDLPRAQAELLKPDSSNSNRRRVADAHLKRYPRDPVVLYAYIASHMRDTIKWSIGNDDRTRYPWALGRALATAFEVLAQPDPEASPIRPALARATNVAAALLALEDRPDAAALEQAGLRLDAYKALDAQPFQDYEREQWFPDSHYRAARGRLRAWQAVLDSETCAQPQFDFLPDYIESRDLRWAFDPLVLRPQFQAWARRKLRERRGSRAGGAIEFDCVDSYRNHATVPEKQMQALIVGRLLAALLAGMPNLVSNAWRLSLFKLPGTAIYLDALFAAGLDPNATMRDGHPLLHYAVEKGDTVAVQAYLAAGADPLREVGNDNALDYANSVAVKKLLEDATRPRAAPADVAQLHAGAKRLNPAEADFCAGLYGDSAGDFDATLAELQRTPPQSWNDALGGALSQRAPWHHLLLARSLALAGVRQPPCGTPGREPMWVCGDLHINGPLELSHPLVVTGDLTVDGPILDCDESLLVVAGSLKARALITEGALLVGGDCELGEFLWGDYNDQQLIVRGALSVPLLVLSDHVARIGDEDRVGYRLDDPDQAGLSAWFVRQAFENEWLSRDRISRLFKSGQPVLRARRAPTPVFAGALSCSRM